MNDDFDFDGEFDLDDDFDDEVAGLEDSIDEDECNAPYRRPAEK